jgi:hypothetical protein
MEGIAKQCLFLFENKPHLNVEPPMEIGGP